MTDEAWDLAYARYERRCAAWNLTAEPLADWQRYWQLFATDADLKRLADAPILVQGF